jgi:hypothetical protein
MRCQNWVCVMVSAKQPDVEWSSGSAAPVIVGSVIAASAVGRRLDGSNTVGLIVVTSRVPKASSIIGIVSGPIVNAAMASVTDQGRRLRAGSGRIPALTERSMTYETRGEKVSKARQRGRNGPGFDYLQASAQQSPVIRYWLNRANHFYRSEKDQGQRQQFDPVNKALSSWLDYVCDLDRTSQAPGSMSEVTNRLHIRLPGPGWVSPFPSFTAWERQKGVGKGLVWSNLILLRQFFAWIIRNEDLNLAVPVDDFDLPLLPQSRKSHRLALTTHCWKGLRSLILEDPVHVTERFQDAAGKRIEVPNPTFPTLSHSSCLSKPPACRTI